MNYLRTSLIYLVWYAKSHKIAKYRQLYLAKSYGGSGAAKYNQVELADGQRS